MSRMLKTTPFARGYSHGSTNDCLTARQSPMGCYAAIPAACRMLGAGHLQPFVVENTNRCNEWSTISDKDLSNCDEPHSRLSPRSRWDKNAIRMIFISELNGGLSRNAGWSPSAERFDFGLTRHRRLIRTFVWLRMY